MSPPAVAQPSKPSALLSAVLFLCSTVLMGYLRLYLFREQLVSLSYGLPLLVCLWHRDRLLLWGMAVTFGFVAAWKAFWLVPGLHGSVQWLQFLLQLVNILIISVVIQIMMGLTERLRRNQAQLEAANAELLRRGEVISRQNEELQAQAEELSTQNLELQQQGEEFNRQNEELQQQAEELEQQAEELQTQAEDLQATNQELHQREEMLQALLTALRDARTEDQMLGQVCRALVQLAGPPAVSAAVVVRCGEQLQVEAFSGSESLRQRQWPLARSFASLVMAQGRTAFIADLAARPDVLVPEPHGKTFRSLLATPLQVNGQCVGAVELYALEARGWTQHEFRVIEWAASQCALVLETARLQRELREAALFPEEDPVPVLRARADGTLIFANRAATALLALWQGAVGRRLPESVCQPVTQVLASARSQELEVEVEGRTLSLTLVPVADQQYVNFYGRDLTERKRAEQARAHLAAIVETSEDAILSKGVDGTILSWNAGAQRLLGYRSEEIIGQPITLLLPPERVHEEEDLIMERLQRGETIDHYETVRLAKDGRRVEVSLSVSPLRDADGRLTGIAKIFRDISVQKEAQRVLARSKEELERLVGERTAKLQELVGELEHFSYTITHDMRAPLRAMKGYGEVLDELCPDLEQKELLRRIMTAADRMDALIRDALSYSRAVRQELPLEMVDTGRLLRGMLDSYPEFQPSRAHIRLQEPLPRVMGNEAGLTQAFSNLLGNAIKFSKTGQTPTIEVRAESRDGWARIWVEDQGIGISPRMLPRVFDMFSRGHSSHEGTGIGLALVRKVLHRMGGRVGVESQEGQGARFWFELKAATAPEV